MPSSIQLMRHSGHEDPRQAGDRLQREAARQADGTGVDLANVKMSMNPLDEIAVEEAIRLKERGVATEIVVVSVGPQKAQETLRTVLTGRPQGRFASAVTVEGDVLGVAAEHWLDTAPARAVFLHSTISTRADRAKRFKASLD